MKSQQELLPKIGIKTMTAKEAIDIIENQFNIKLFGYQKLILEVLWKDSRKKNLKRL